MWGSINYDILPTANFRRNVIPANLFGEIVPSAICHSAKCRAPHCIINFSFKSSLHISYTDFGSIMLCVLVDPGLPHGESIGGFQLSTSYIHMAALQVSQQKE